LALMFGLVATIVPVPITKTLLLGNHRIARIDLVE
jgi:hypothetical protein